MPAPNKKNIMEWFGDYLRKSEMEKRLQSHEAFPARSIDVGSAAFEMAKKIKSASSHKSVDSALDYVNDAIRGHGVEAIRGEHHVDSYYGDIVGLYVNTGDTYNPTLVYDTSRESFVLTTMGDWVEKNSRRYKII